MHITTGFSPFFLLFGREPTLHIDLMFPREGVSPQSHVDYAEKWRGSMQEVYNVAQENMSKAGERGQKYYSQRAWSSVLEPGDHVLIRNLSERGGPRKIGSYWESQVHVVKERRGESSPVYVVKPLDGEGRERTLHRNLLLPCPYLVDSQSTKRLRERSKDHKKEKNNAPKPRVKTPTSYGDSESSSEEEYAVWMPGHSQNTHLNPQAPVFKPTMRRLSRVGVQTERLIQDERSQPQDGGGTTPDRDQVEETTQQEQDMIQSQDSCTEEILEPEHRVCEEDALSSGDDHEPERARRSTRIRQPRCIPTTTVGTTNNVTTTPMGDSTTNSKTTKDTGGSVSTGSTAQPHTGLTTEGCVCTSSTAQPDTDCYGPEDMAALGATLGILLLICVVVIVVLACDVRRGKADWRKIYETNIFRSSLSQGSDGQKGGIHYTNDAFHKDEDGDRTQQTGQSVVAFEEPQKAMGDLPVYEAILKSSAPLHSLLHDDISQSGSDRSDSEKEVKPILTKERRMDDGYKSVWFKEDIDPDAKEEVVIIPGSQESDSEEEDEEQIKRVALNDADLDSGLGLKMDDRAENSSC